ncbi:hypothetical protein PR048_001637 [Dryococelus australis]|uniref:C2H2-type domain-containing protein n=1 Tax=Dryococelus australis TaxID=614101 RepID=A0ABQ9IHX4_9NEOP|nr:hypothetical protein PR048_001637 [Dryococelus australis]
MLKIQTEETVVTVGKAVCNLELLNIVKHGITIRKYTSKPYMDMNGIHKTYKSLLSQRGIPFNKERNFKPYLKDLMLTTISGINFVRYGSKPEEVFSSSTIRVIVGDNGCKNDTGSEMEFHFRISEPIEKSDVAPLYDRSPTDLPVLQTILSHTQKTNSQLIGEGKTPIIALDGELFSRAVEMENYKDIAIFRLGSLHIIMASLKCLGKYIEGSGTDLAWELIGMYGPSVIQQILEGRHVYKGIEAHLTTLTAVFTLFVKEVSNGSWKQHLDSQEEMCVYFHAHDQLNYARWAPLYIADMSELESMDPEAFNFLDNRNFVISYSDVPFTALDTDHAIEHKKKMKARRGGFVGITGNPKALNKYFIIAPVLSSTVEESKAYAVIDSTQRSSLHHESFIKGEKNLVEIFVEKIAVLTYDCDVRFLFDNYIEGSMKDKTRQKRAGKYDFVHYHVTDSTKISSLKKFLLHVKTTAELTIYLSEKLIDYYKCSNKDVLIAFESKYVSYQPLHNVVAMQDMQQEIAQKDQQTVLDVYSLDTDVFVLLIGSYPPLPPMTTLSRGKDKLSIQENYCRLGKHRAEALSFDWPCKAFMESDHNILQAFYSYGTDTEIPEDINRQMEINVCRLYRPCKCDIESIPELRWYLSANLVKKVENFLPQWDINSAHQKSLLLPFHTDEDFVLCGILEVNMSDMRSSEETSQQTVDEKQTCCYCEKEYLDKGKLHSHKPVMHVARWRILASHRHAILENKGVGVGCLLEVVPSLNNSSYSYSFFVSWRRVSTRHRATHLYQEKRLSRDTEARGAWPEQQSAAIFKWWTAQLKYVCFTKAGGPAYSMVAVSYVLYAFTDAQFDSNWDPVVGYEPFIELCIVTTLDFSRRSASSHRHAGNEISLQVPISAHHRKNYRATPRHVSITLGATVCTIRTHAISSLCALIPRTNGRHRLNLIGGRDCCSDEVDGKRRKTNLRRLTGMQRSCRVPMVLGDQSPMQAPIVIPLVSGLIEARYRRQDCKPIQSLARRGDESVDAHVSVAPSVTTLLGLKHAKFLHPGGHLNGVSTAIRNHLGSMGHQSMGSMGLGSMGQSCKGWSNNRSQLSTFGVTMIIGERRSLEETDEDINALNCRGLRPRDHNTQLAALSNIQYIAPYSATQLPTETARRVDADARYLQMLAACRNVSMEQRRGKCEMPEKTHRSTVPSSSIPTCENPGVTPSGIEHSSPRWESNHITAASVEDPPLRTVEFPRQVSRPPVHSHLVRLGLANSRRLQFVLALGQKAFAKDYWPVDRCVCRIISRVRRACDASQVSPLSTIPQKGAGGGGGAMSASPRTAHNGSSLPMSSQAISHWIQITGSCRSGDWYTMTQPPLRELLIQVDSEYVDVTNGKAMSSNSGSRSYARVSTICKYQGLRWLSGLLACRLPPRRTRSKPRPGHRIFACGKRAGQCLWLTGYLTDLPFPWPFRYCSILTSTTLTRFQYLAVKNRPNLFIHFTHLQIL